MSDDKFISRKRLLAGCLGLSLACLLHSAPIRAEGSAQIGLNQRLLDFDRSLAQTYAIDTNSASLFVDILTAGEVINISVCGRVNTDDINIEIFDPDDVSVFTTSLTDSNVDCADAMDAPLANPVRYASVTTGAYRLELQNTSSTTFASSIFERYDISVTPNLVTNPDPSVAAGRLWAYSWNFNAGSFDEVDSTDADYFVLVPGGRPNTNYVWQLALNKFAGYGYNIIANEIGVNAPNSGYSTPKNNNSATYLFSVYTGVPAIADPLPTLPPSVTNTRFIDSDGTDSGISPGDTDGIQDTGTFEFESDVTGTYGIFIDIDQDGTFGNAGDVLLLGSVATGLNQVPWDGTDALGNVLPVGAYNAQINVRMGEYHFVANDVETSGGPAADGMTIFLSDLAGNTSNTQIYWDDVTVLGAGAGGLSTLPLGESSGLAAGKHTWGDFSSTGFGNERFIDTYVFGLTTKATATPRVTSDNALLTGVDGTVDISDGSLPGDTLTITVTDADLNTNSGITESVVVDVVNDVTGELEQLLLTETDVDSGVFVGTLLTAPGAVADANNNGAMNTQSTNTITVTYTDAIDAAGASVPRTDVSTVDTDTDGDGVGDTNDADPADPCVPGFPSASCPDTDNDGAADNGTPTTSVPVEPDAGADNDPCVPDNSVPVCDTDNDGISDGDEIANGTDPNDSDSDGDGIPDGAENMDADGDGINDASDNDSDNDGIPDSLEAGPTPAMPIDSDNDGLPDFVDPDADDDGIPDSVEGFGDSDTDGVPDYLDPDSDDDGLPDTIEDDVAFGVDMDNDGIDDGYDVSFSGGIDTNGDGVDDALDPIDTDGDGNADYVDIDSDNDGIPDTIEADLDVLADGDSDQINDVYDVNATMGADLDGDGVDDAIAPTDTDGDTAPDYVDLDSDNDSLLDVAEAGGQDFDGDGIILEPALNEGSLTMPTDSDADGTGDWREVDSDNDGTNDIVGSQFESDDIDGDGIVDVAADADGDGISDAIDQFDGFGTARDADRDGILDDNEGTGDSDGDGLPDAQDTDSDNDGIPDAIEAGPNPGSPVDTDADGLPDYRDTDSDGDGIGDDLEGTADSNGNGIPDYIDSGGALETAVTGVGGGSLGFWSLLVLALLVISRRTAATAVAPLVLAGFIISILPAERGYADSLCGHYTDPGDDRYFYLGDDPDLDRAEFESCWYAGLGWGYSYVSPDEEANNFLHDTSENHDNGLQVFLGKQLSPHWWLELKYADLGEAGITNRNPAIAAAFPDAAITYEVPSLMAGYQWRVQKNLKPFLKIGLSAISNDATGGPVPFEKQTSVQLAFGGGLKYDFGRNRWFVRGDFDWYDRDAWYAGASVGLFFGHDAEDRPAVVPVLDRDNDGVMDPNDICPATAAGVEVDGSGCPVIKDSDGDGVVDSGDACPDTPAGTRVNQRGCSIDADGDGVLNERDQCPDTEAGAAVDVNGCEIRLEIRLPGVQFESDSDVLRPGAERVMNDAAQTLSMNPGLVVEVAGYSDDRGNADHNRGLSERRAATVRDYLIGRGIAPDRMTVMGYGESDPIADNGTADGRAENRRVVLRIIDR